MSQIYKTQTPGPPPVSGVETLTGNTGGAVPPTGGNINILADPSTGFTFDGNIGTSTLTLSSTIGLPVSNFTVDEETAPGTLTVIPDATGNVVITGGQVAANTTANVLQTHSTAQHEYSVEVQRSTTAAAATVGLNGVSHFNSDHFTVDTDGFVGLEATALGVLTLSGDIGTNPVSPDVNGNIDIVGQDGIISEADQANNSIILRLAEPGLCGGAGTSGAVTATLWTFPMGVDDQAFTFSVIVTGKAVGQDAAVGGSIFGTFFTDGTTGASVDPPDIIKNASALLDDADFNLVVSGNDILCQATGVAGENINWTACARIVQAGVV